MDVGDRTDRDSKSMYHILIYFLILSVRYHPRPYPSCLWLTMKFDPAGGTLFSLPNSLLVLTDGMDLLQNFNDFCGDCFRFFGTCRDREYSFPSLLSRNARGGRIIVSSMVGLY